MGALVLAIDWPPGTAAFATSGSSWLLSAPHLPGPSFFTVSTLQPSLSQLDTEFHIWLDVHMAVRALHLPLLTLLRFSLLALLSQKNCQAATLSAQ